jgi:hypothetical protein
MFAGGLDEVAVEHLDADSGEDFADFLRELAGANLESPVHDAATGIEAGSLDADVSVDKERDGVIGVGFEELSAGLEGFIDEPEAEQVDDEFPEDGFAVGVFGGELAGLSERDFGLVAGKTVDPLQICEHILAAELEFLTAAAGAGSVRVDGHFGALWK